VTVARTAPSNCRYHLRRPFMATRVLGLLDEVVSRSLSAAEPMATHAPTTHTPPVAAQVGGQDAARATALAQQVATAAESELRYRALVVDDSLAVRRQIGLALDAAEVRADFADSGEAALELLTGGAYDIVFLDVVMPGMDGYAVCRTIKRNRATRHLPVVMLTGKSSPFDKVKGKLSGCNTYLTKPVARKAFEDTLKTYLKQPILLD
jgi:twitching motility two-component system response regulator PilG